MKTDSALRSILGDLTIALSEDKKLRNVELFDNPKKFGDAPKEDYIRLNPNPAKLMGIENEITSKQEFSLIVSTESHELEHQVVSDLNSIREFAKEYPARPRMAGLVMNAIEDTYVDKRRTDRDRGLRPVSAMFAHYWIKSQSNISDISGADKYTAAVFQITRGNGTPKGFEKVTDEDFRDYCANVRIIIEKARTTYIQKERMELGHDIMNLIENEIGKAEVPDDTELPKGVKPTNDEELPDANEENVQEDNQLQGNEENVQEESVCPVCGHDNPVENIEKVDSMTAARCSAPFNPDSDWVKNVEFIAHDEDNGLCGFRVKTTGEIPKSQIESQGYKVVELSNSIEILEPKSRYNDDTPITKYDCPECNHEWFPTVTNI